MWPKEFLSNATTMLQQLNNEAVTETHQSETPSVLGGEATLSAIPSVTAEGKF